MADARRSTPAVLNCENAVSPSIQNRYRNRRGFDRGPLPASAWARRAKQGGKCANPRSAKGIPPRAAPADYQAHAQAGAITVAAEFTGHSVPTPDAILATEDYVVIEVGLFGPPEARVKLSHEFFSLRINGKKAPLPAQPYTLVFNSLKDPEWAPVPAESKSKTSIGSGGKSQSDPGSTPAPVHIPIEVERAMQLRVQKASLAEGDRVLPEAGLSLLPAPRQDHWHPFDRADLHRSGREGNPEAPAIIGRGENCLQAPRELTPRSTFLENNARLFFRLLPYR